MSDEIKFDWKGSKERYNIIMGNFRSKYKYILFGIKILGNLGIIYFLLMKDWFNAFLMYVIFFPEEVSIIKAVKRITAYGLRKTEKWN